MPETKQLILIGSPNCGKTTLYNWLTKSQYKTVNFPGSTVEILTGNLTCGETFITTTKVIDTPGVYSLNAQTPDELVTRQIIDGTTPLSSDQQAYLVVIDGTQLLRQMHLAEVFKRSRRSFAIVITMKDVLQTENAKRQVDQLKQYFQCPIILFNGQNGAGLQEICETVEKLKTSSPAENPLQNLSDQEIITFKKQLGESVLNFKTVHDNYLPITKRFDSYLLHPAWGYLFFAAIMISLFGSIFWAATPLMDLIDNGSAELIETLTTRFPDSLLMDFFAHGILASFASVLVFIPQIFILFLGLGTLEASGYLARASTLIDRPLSRVGLSGRSFVPLLSGFACAIPAMMATRTISNPKERWIALSIIPLMSCSARLPVYSLFIVFLLPQAGAFLHGVMFFALYLITVILGALASSILSKLTASKNESRLLLELPVYRKPRWPLIARQSFNQTKNYFFKAGPVIFALSVLIWFSSNFPRVEMTSHGSPEISQSYLGQLGQAINPVFEPMGLDWRVGIGLISSFAAREVFVSTLALVFGTTSDEEGLQDGLLSAMKNATHAETQMPLFTISSVMGLIFFFMIALQCLSTFAISKKESGSWKFAIFQLLSLNVIAYTIAVIIQNIPL